MGQSIVQSFDKSERFCVRGFLREFTLEQGVKNFLALGQN